MTLAVLLVGCLSAHLAELAGDDAAHEIHEWGAEPVEPPRHFGRGRDGDNCFVASNPFEVTSV